VQIKNRGFTLIEIMITLAIVGITFGVIITSASSVRKSGRDGQRQSDLLSLKAALQNFYADQQHFPNNFSTPDIPTTGSLTNCTNEPASPACTVSKTYLQLFPTDPSTGVTYKYTSRYTNLDATTCTNTTNSGNCHSYILCAKLEGTSSQTSTQYANCTTAGYSGYNYQLMP
jgi:prepilin-type N-terminal cleavage/methylation domain-containing protein